MNSLDNLIEKEAKNLSISLVIPALNESQQLERLFSLFLVLKIRFNR